MESFFKEVCDQLGKLPKAKSFDVDINEVDSYIIVKTDVPNVDPQNIKIYTEDPLSITIHSVPKKNDDTRISRSYQKERTSDEKKRTVKLPKFVIFQNSYATYTHGTLTITLPIDTTIQSFEKRFIPIVSSDL